MTTPTEIANRALIAIAAKSTMTNMALEKTPEAVQCRTIYDSTRDALLRGAHWNFARRYLPLSQTKAAPGQPGSNADASLPWNPDTWPSPPWLFEYLYPADCLLMRYITPRPNAQIGGVSNMFSVPVFAPQQSLASIAVPFNIAMGSDAEGGYSTVVNTNTANAVGCYTARVTVEDRWDPSFQEAMVAALAARLALSITGNVQVAQANARQAMETLQMARLRDGNEGTTKIDREASWIRARTQNADMPIPGTNFVGWVDPAFLMI